MRSAALGFLVACLMATSAAAQSPFAFSDAPDGAPILIDADEIIYDTENERVLALGDVSIVQGARALSADRIDYFIAEDRVIATGDATLLEPGGEVVRAELVELRDGLKRAVAEQLGVRLRDGSRLVGRRVERVSGVRTTLVDGAFTPCALCERDPEKAPTWRLRARKVEHDEVERKIGYEDVTLDVAGVSVAYLPYFSHPDPTVERATGFLAPSLFFGGEFDAVAQVPYYWELAPNQDLTLQPFFTVRSAPVAAAEYRHLFANGRVTLDGSVGVLKRTTENGDVERRKLRGHLFASGDFALDETWRLRFDGGLASDDSYLETFNIEDDDVLRSQLAFEGFWRESYVRVGGFGVQDLRRTAVQNDSPFVLPEVRAALLGTPGPYGNAFAEIDARALGRKSGADGQSASAKVGWRAPLTTAGGHRFDLEASVRGDVYNTSDGDNIGAVGSDTVARAVPKLVAGWRFPLVQQNGWGALVVEPRVQVVAGLDDVRNRDVPNEDSRAIEFDESNFFAPDRFPGRDQVDDGQRVDYGLTATGLFPNGGRASLFVGQSTSRQENDFARASGMSGRTTDVVAAATVSPAPWLDLNARARLDKEDYGLRRQEVSIGVGPPRVRLNLAYVRTEAEAQGPEQAIAAEQMDARLDFQFDERWRISARHHRDLDAGRSLLWSASMTYSDECISVDLGFSRDFASQADGGGKEDTLFLRVNFKHLGGLGVSQAVGGSGEDER